ncbi:glycosyltransferase family 4 protein [Myroides injenensis]|uniref:glycosyltransferase family 4 protein n=1 Tax=Myroides injenensis TaxID=1183151 RepID=UPI000288CD2C|nr:glycosyltransferase family 4 protein [Myroides injenensis]
MNILYIHQYFITPKEPGGTRSYWIAQEMIKHGHNVTMITSSTKYKEKVIEMFVDGIKVIYINEEYSQNMSIAQRFKAFLSFMYKSSKIALRQKDIDLLFATSTPLTIGVPALIMKMFKKVPYVFEVRDLWPEVPIQMGALRNPIVRSLALRLEKTIYNNARHVIALSPGMCDGVLKYIDKSKVSMVPNMSKIDEFWPRPYNFSLMESLGIKKEIFKVIHFGALGKANGADSIIEAAKLLKDNTSIHFLFIGGGSTEQDLKEKCIEFDLTNVKFLGKFPMNKTSEIVNFSDVSIVSFLDLPILYTNSPNKLFDSLSAGKPIIVNSAGWTKDLVEEYRCGFYVNPNVPQELVDRILELQANPDSVREMGEKSRWLAENKFDKSILTKQIVQIIESL